VRFAPGVQVRQATPSNRAPCASCTVRRTGAVRGGARPRAALREVAVPVVDDELGGATATLRTNVGSPGAGDAVPMELTAVVRRPLAGSATGGAGSDAPCRGTIAVYALAGPAPGEEVVSLLIDLLEGLRVREQPVCRATLSIHDAVTAKLQLQAWSIRCKRYEDAAELPLTVSRRR
jgi:hypothetical protein